MIVKYPDVTLLIQGFGRYKDTMKDAYGNTIAPSGEERLDFMPFIEYYRTLFKDIILSTWTEDVDAELRKFCKTHGIILVHQASDLGNMNTMYNMSKQFLSCNLGVQKVKTKYTLKHRTDERYSNLDKLIDLFLEDDIKLVSGSTIFACKGHYKFHVGDHLYICKTETLKKVYKNTIERIIENVFECNNTGVEPAPEITLTKNFLTAMDEHPTDENHDQLMLKYTNLLNDEHMDPYIVRFNTIGKIYRRPEDKPDFWKDYQTVDDILNKNTMRI